ncbi:MULTISPECIES: hypothetical protein [unclassified Streptomyces]|uniref:hypothetical protein n=1 Tax=unclassified Streptomyces TaxID=2593676 RepID=UPI00278C82E1|nr:MULTISPECIES: hypothetical protein [unclassified Streptomyces]
MPTIHLKTLKCVAQEDWTTHDDPRLDVNGENILLPRMRDGDKYPIDAYHVFDGEVTVTLREADALPGDRDDLLGSHTLSEEGSGILHFTKDEANYQLSYTLTRN